MTHDLNSTDVMTDIQGKITLDSGSHQRYLGTTSHTGSLGIRGSGGEQGDWNSLIQKPEGGYLIAGDDLRSDSAIGTASVVEINALGNVEWITRYGRDFKMHLNSIARTHDNGYVVAGSNYSTTSMDFYLSRTDSSGMRTWEHTYGGAGSEEAYAVVQTSDDGFILSGNSGSGLFLVKTDADGVMQWNRTFSGTYSIRSPASETTDGGYITGGIVDWGGGNTDFWLAKMTASGIVQWIKTYGGPSSDTLVAVFCTNEGGYLLGGSSPSESIFIKTDADGNIVWERRGEQPLAGSCLIQIQGGGFLSAGGGSVLATDALGNVLWKRTYKPVWFLYKAFRAALETDDGGYALVGTIGEGFDNWGPFFVAIDCEFGLTWTESTAYTITLYRGATDPYWNFVRVRLWKPR